MTTTVEDPASLYEARRNALRAYEGSFAKVGAYDDAVMAAATVADVEQVVKSHRDPWGLVELFERYEI